ncbi:MAG: TonB-dependent receptor plug domain-containing protein, partial [Campylobacterales bacterium]|nr:TonB-dependent receptor plug domain-containing protein [Campylobacterales bacterium]
MKKIILPIVILCSSLYSSKNLGNVVVTGNMYQQNIEDLTSTIDVIDSKTIKERHFKTLGDIFQSIGLPSLSSGGMGQQTSFYLRGFSTEKTLILVDGVSFNDPTTIGSQGEIAHILVEDIERVEILKGPQSGVWGSSALSGVVNIITKAPSDKLKASINSEAGSYNTKKINFSLSKKEDLFSYYISGVKVQTDGFSAKITKGKTSDDHEKDGYENTTFKSRIAITPTKQDKLELVLTKIDGKIEFDGTSPDDDSREITQNNFIQKLSYSHTFNGGSIVEVYTDKADFLKEDPNGFTKKFEGVNKSFGGNFKLSYNSDDMVVIGGDSKASEDKISNKEVTSSGLFISNTNRFSNLVFTQSLRQDKYSDFDDKVTGKIGGKFLFANDLSVLLNY